MLKNTKNIALQSGQILYIFVLRGGKVTVLEMKLISARIEFASPTHVALRMSLCRFWSVNCLF